MKQNRKIFTRLKTISLYGLSQILSVFSILLLSLIIVKFHSVELWGEYAEILIWTNVFLLFLSFGNNDYLLKSFSKRPSEINQTWLNNILARSILLIPSIALILFIPIFKDLELFIFLLILFQFLNQSFKSLIVFHRRFKLNIAIESFFLLVLFILVFYQLDSLNLKTLIQLISIAQASKFTAYAFLLLKGFKNLNYNIQFIELKRSLPFFIPLVVGTFRSKIDTYYSALFFNTINLSKYQILISFLALTQMASSFAITPYLKNYYRFKNETIKNIQKRFFYFGWVIAFIATLIIFVILSNIYQFNFYFFQYGLVFLFVVPLFLHILLVSEYYKKDKQYKIAYFASIIVIFQLIAGYFLTKYLNINGALLLKVLGQWSIVVLLWFWIKKQKED